MGEGIEVAAPAEAAVLRKMKLRAGMRWGPGGQFFPKGSVLVVDETTALRWYRHRIAAPTDEDPTSVHQVAGQAPMPDVGKLEVAPPPAPTADAGDSGDPAAALGEKYAGASRRELMDTAVMQYGIEPQLVEKAKNKAELVELIQRAAAIRNN